MDKIHEGRVYIVVNKNDINNIIINDPNSNCGKCLYVFSKKENAEEALKKLHMEDKYKKNTKPIIVPGYLRINEDEIDLFNL